MSGFWPWALETYARPGVSAACLHLQDAHGQNVPLLLWAVWSQDHAPDADLQRGAALARRWEDAAGGRLRAARRALKAQTPDLGLEERLAFRERLKRLELEGERLLMAALEDLPRAERAAAEPLPARLARAAAAYGAPAGEEVFAPLLALL